MQARTALRGIEVSSTLVALAAATFALGLGSAAGYVANGVSGSMGTHTSAVPGWRIATFGTPVRRTGYQVLAGKAIPEPAQPKGFAYPATHMRIGAHI